jgi:hypothetical protein
MNETHDPEDEFDQMIDRAVEDTAKAIKERDNQDYDGVVGVPPEDWVPEWAINSFRHYRNRLLDVRGYMPSDLIKMIAQYRSCFYAKDRDPSKFCPPTVYPNGKNVDLYCFQDEIGFLSWLKWCVDQGPESGLKLLAGGFAAKGLKFSHRDSPKKGKEYEPKKSIRKICEFIESSNFDDVLAALRNADCCNDWYESTQDPIGVLFTEVDDDLQIISFMRRGETPNNQDERSFGTLRNILTDIRK